MDIDELLNRYFEGETSSEEERELRAFFTSGNVPDRLAVYTPMFTYLEEESRKERQPDEALIPIDEDILFMLDAVFCLMPCGVSAAETQKDLKIQEVFQRYGKKRNVTMVELSNEMLETYGMTRYKSITIKDDPEALRFTRQCLEADQKGARKIKEVTDDGGVVSAYYQLKGVEADINRFVLFKVSKKGVITLVYIEGDLDSDDLITLLFTKKDL